MNQSVRLKGVEIQTDRQTDRQVDTPVDILRHTVSEEDLIPSINTVTGPMSTNNMLYTPTTDGTRPV